MVLTNTHYMCDTLPPIAPLLLALILRDIPAFFARSPVCLPRRSTSNRNITLGVLHPSTWVSNESNRKRTILAQGERLYQIRLYFPIPCSEISRSGGPLRGNPRHWGGFWGLRGRQIHRYRGDLQSSSAPKICRGYWIWVSCPSRFFAVAENRGYLVGEIAIGLGAVIFPFINGASAHHYLTRSPGLPRQKHTAPTTG